MQTVINNKVVDSSNRYDWHFQILRHSARTISMPHRKYEPRSGIDELFTMKCSFGCDGSCSSMKAVCQSFHKSLHESILKSGLLPAHIGALIHIFVPFESNL